MWSSKHCGVLWHNVWKGQNGSSVLPVGRDPKFVTLFFQWIKNWKIHTVYAPPQIKAESAAKGDHLIFVIHFSSVVFYREETIDLQA